GQHRGPSSHRGKTGAQLAGLGEHRCSNPSSLPVWVNDDLRQCCVKDPVAEEPGEADEPSVMVGRKDDAHGVDECRLNGVLVVVVSATPSGSTVECDHLGCLGSLTHHEDKGIVLATSGHGHLPTCGPSRLSSRAFPGFRTGGQA